MMKIYVSRRAVNAALFCTGAALVLGGAYHGMRHNDVLHYNVENHDTRNNENKTTFDGLGAAIIIAGMAGVAVSFRDYLR
jgi:hypothetical protein